MSSYTKNKKVLESACHILQKEYLTAYSWRFLVTYLYKRKQLKISFFSQKQKKLQKVALSGLFQIKTPPTRISPTEKTKIFLESA